MVVMDTFAHRLGFTPHRSLLLQRARRLGLGTFAALEALAWQRGCRYYPRRDAGAIFREPDFSNEDLTIALMHPALPWDPQRLRLAAAMLAARGNDPRRLARLAILEQAVVPLRYIASAGQVAEPANPFWQALTAALPPSAPPPPGVMPHPSRFAALAGKTRPGSSPSPASRWIRPLLPSPA
jgi:hypothetical protein